MAKKLKDRLFDNALTQAIGDNAFVNMVAGLGTVRDKASAATFSPTARMKPSELNDIYYGDWVAQRIIGKPSYDALRKGWYFKNLTPEQDAQIKVMADAIRLDKVLLRALVLSRLHGWAYILIGERGTQDLDSELLISNDDLEFLSVLKRSECRAKSGGNYLPANLANGRWDVPEFYEIGQYEKKRYVHHSRLIRIDCPDPVGCDDGLPMPILQQVKSTLLNHASINANANSLVYEAKIDIIRVPRLMDSLRQNAGSAINLMIKRFASVATLKGNNGMIVLDKDEEYISKTYSFGGLSDLMREFKVETAGAAGIPYPMLFGQSTNGLGSTGDFEIRTYYDDINTMQEGVLREPLEKILSLMAQSLGFNVPNFGLVFMTLWQIDDKVRSEIERANSERDRNYLDMGVLTEEQIARQLVDDGTYTTIDDAHIQLLASVVNRNDEE